MTTLSFPNDRQYASIGRLIASWSHFVENIEEAIDALERNGVAEARATPDRKVMQRFNYFMRIACETALRKEYERLRADEPKIVKIKKLRDALAHGNVSCWSESSTLPQIMAFNLERGQKVRHASDPETMHRHCLLLSQASIDLHLISRHIAFGF